MFYLRFSSVSFQMLLSVYMSRRFIKTLSTTSCSGKWRSQIQQNQLVSQISCILIQGHNWIPLLKRLNLSSKINPSLLLRILRKTETHPQISINFFFWVKTNLGFQPDLLSHCHVIQAAIQSGIYRPVKPVLDSLTQNHTTSALVGCMIQASKGRDSSCKVLSVIIESYSTKGLFLEGLEVLNIMKLHGFTPTVEAYNALLDALLRENKIEFGRCLLGALIRHGLNLNRSTWSLVAQLLSKNGKFDRISRLLDFGIFDTSIYNLMLDGYSKNGDFKAAFDTLNEMCHRKLVPDFSTYSSVLDGACKHENDEVIKSIISIMVNEGLLPNSSSFDYGLVIKNFTKLSKTYAAEWFYRRACVEKITLQSTTYGAILKTLSENRRTAEAISAYHLISEQGVTVDDDCYIAFGNVLCGSDECEEAYELLKDIIRGGYIPSDIELSKYLTSLCNKERWREAEDMLNLLLEKGLVLDCSCPSSLIEHHCSRRQIDSAIALHDKMEKFNLRLDLKSYNVLLNRLIDAKRVEQAVKVFDNLRRYNLLSSPGFTIMIHGLCGVKEFRKAMKLHDEMLKLGMKPDKATYKILISKFKP